MFLTINNKVIGVARCQTMSHIYHCYMVYPGGVSTQLQYSGLVAHENGTFRNLALADYVPFVAEMDASFD